MSLAASAYVLLASSSSEKASLEGRLRGDAREHSSTRPSATTVDSASTLAGDAVLPVFNLLEYLDGREDKAQAVCQSIAACMSKTGCVIVRDPRVGAADNACFLDLMERYFGQSREAKMADVRPDVHYQVGATPDGVEVPRCMQDPDCKARMESLPAQHRAVTPCGADPKWRFFWRIGPRPAHTSYAELNAQPVLPKGFPTWADVMNGWGMKVLAAAETVAEMLARGFGLPADAFTRRMHCGPHLLAPTGVDLAHHGKAGACYAGYHYDLNFLSVHGKSRFPGLFVWLRDGRRIPVSIPDGCLLLQAGKQLEWLTGGHVQAGMHEVVNSEATNQAVAAATAAGRSTWRVSSTVFGHIASDELLTPLGSFATRPGVKQEYPPVLAGQYVQSELEAIKLKV